MTTKRQQRLIWAMPVIATAGVLVWQHFAANPHEPRTEKVFVYGTLLNPIVRSAVCSCFLETTQAQLLEYAKHGRNIVPTASSTVTGAVITVSAWELERLDRYERTPEKYTRERINIMGEEMWVYIRTGSTTTQ